jgi:hypothetical protein
MSARNVSQASAVTLATLWRPDGSANREPVGARTAAYQPCRVIVVSLGTLGTDAGPWPAGRARRGPGANRVPAESVGSRWRPRVVLGLVVAVDLAALLLIITEAVALWQVWRG